jgi:hypothetical protein
LSFGEPYFLSSFIQESEKMKPHFLNDTAS